MIKIKMFLLYLIAVTFSQTVIAQKTTHVKIRITEGNKNEVTSAMVCITNVKDGKVRLPPYAKISDSVTHIQTFYEGIDYKADKNWIGPVRKTNGLSLTNEDRSNIYGVLPSIPYWREPVMYQTSGDFYIDLPAGKWRISIEHGNEFVPIREVFTVNNEKEMTKTFALKRWINLPSRGWYSGDVHVHHPTVKPQFKNYLLEYARAEDIHLVNVLEMGHHFGRDFKQAGFGEKFRLCKKDICLVSGQEDPRSYFGHIIGLNISEFARDTSVYNYYDVVFKKLHLQQGALVGFAHFSFNGCDLQRGFPWYITTGQIDFVELLQFSHLNALDYYDYLNLGFRITAAAGSDVPWGSTLGEVRTFVYTGNSYSADNWFKGLKDGHSFVSNGPALLLTADGELPGTEIMKTSGSGTQIKVKALSNPGIGVINSLAIYNNDGLVAEKYNENKSDSVEIELTHILKRSQWLAAYVNCDNGAVAHTTPVYFIVDGHPTWDAAKGPEIIRQQLYLIQQTEDEERAKNRLDAGIAERMNMARAFYNNLLKEMKSK